MRLLLISLVVFLTGCSTVPVERKFPAAPPEIMKPCPNLKTLSNDPPLSEVAKTISENYTLYYECAIKQDAFIEWYNTQKKIFESVK